MSNDESSLRTQELQNANFILKQQNELIETIIDSSVALIVVFHVYLPCMKWKRSHVNKRYK